MSLTPTCNCRYQIYILSNAVIQQHSLKTHFFRGLFLRSYSVLSLEFSWNVMAHGDAQKGKWWGELANGVCSQYSSHYLGTRFIQHYYRWCAHLGLPAVDWTDAPRGDLTFWRRNYFFFNFSTPVYKMWIIQTPNTLQLWNKQHFEEKKTDSIYHV